LDIEFQVPFTHRLRFTEDCLGADWSVLEKLFVGLPDVPIKVHVWVDQGITDGQPGLQQQLAECFGRSDLAFAVRINAISGGESVKNQPEHVERILKSVNDDNLDRRSYIVAIGGGAMLDVVGYAAAVAHRGIRLIRIPTTTLAQADSGVGVKNAVNYFGKKNWKGTFAVPWAVVNDHRLLETLSDRDFCCGFSEAVKVALLKDSDHFRWLHQNAAAIAERDKSVTSVAIRRSVQMHLDHITEGGDPFEALEARPLDFGHWSAHKLETLTDYEVRHGEAVSIGVALDTIYSHLKFGFPKEAMTATLETLQRLRLPLFHERLNSHELISGIEEFRQHLGGRLTVTMLEDVGQPINVHEMDESLIRKSIELASGFSAQSSP
jgi:3-dehydroquinate synthase